MGVVLQANAAPQLTLGSPTIMQGGTGSLTLSIYGGTEPYAGVNAKILLPHGITVTGVYNPEGFRGAIITRIVKSGVQKRSERGTFCMQLTGYT